MALISLEFIRYPPSISRPAGDAHSRQDLARPAPKPGWVRVPHFGHAATGPAPKLSGRLGGHALTPGPEWTERRRAV